MTPSPARHPETFEDLPDKLLLRVLQELPQADLLQVARVSPRLHDLSLDGALWRDLGTLGPDVPTEQACLLLRNAPDLTALRLHNRDDADAILLEVSRYCRGLETLHLTRCRGNKTFRFLAYLPLLKVAQNCRRLRQVRFVETDFMTSRVFKVWADLRGPEDPALEISVNSLTRRQANYLTTVLDGPPELHDHALQGTPCVLHVYAHTLSLGEELAEEEHVAEEATEAWQSPSLAGTSSRSPLSGWTPALATAASASAPACEGEAVEGAAGSSSARVRPAPSASSSSDAVPSYKRPRWDPDHAQAPDADNAGDGLVTVFVRPASLTATACAASTSTGLGGPVRTPRRYAVDHVAGEENTSVDGDMDDMDVVVASPLCVQIGEHEQELAVAEDGDDEGGCGSSSTPRRPPGTLEYRSVFGMGCTSEPLVNSWFRSGYYPDFGVEEHEEVHAEDHEQQVFTLSLPGDVSEEEDEDSVGPVGSSRSSRSERATVEATAVVEDVGVLLGSPRPRPLPPWAARLADSLKEPEPELQPGGDLQPASATASMDQNGHTGLGKRASLPAQQSHGQHGSVDGDHAPDEDDQ